MKSRLAVLVAAVVVPLVVLGVVITRGGSSSSPARLPIAAAGTEQATLAGARADAALYPYPGVVYKAGPDMPALDGSARAFKVSGTADEDQVRRLANALGLDGAVTRDGSGTLNVGDSDAQLNVYPASGGQWNFFTSSGSGVVSSGTAVACAPDTLDCPVPQTTIAERPADLPTHDEAKQLALDVLRNAGVDTSSAAVTVDDYTTQWSVRVDPIVDGISTIGYGTSITIGDHGVVEYANGVIGSAQQADEYPLIGTKAAIDALNEGRGFVGPRPLIAQDLATGAPESSCQAAEPAIVCPPDTPTSGTIPQQEVTLTGAERVLLFATSYDGNDGYLVPAYRFQTADGEGPTVLAIDDTFLAPPPDQGFGTDGKEPATDVAPPSAVEPQPATVGPPDTIEPGK
jgi:hypothetical protein